MDLTPIGNIAKLLGCGSSNRIRPGTRRSSRQLLMPMLLLRLPRKQVSVSLLTTHPSSIRDIRRRAERSWWICSIFASTSNTTMCNFWRNVGHGQLKNKNAKHGKPNSFPCSLLQLAVINTSLSHERGFNCLSLLWDV